MVVAYLSSEIPSTSATFVYREILEVEKQGHRVVPFTLRRAEHLAVEAHAQELATRVTTLYERPLRGLGRIVRQTTAHPVRVAAACGALFMDLRVTAVGNWPKLLFKFLAGIALARRLNVAGCEHLHIHFAHAPATVGMYGAYAAGIPFSVTAHANDIYENAELLAAKVRRARPFVTISEFNRRHLLKLFPDARIEVVRCGIGAEAVAPACPENRRAPDEPLHIVGVGRLVPKKGFDILLCALEQLEAWGIPWRCTLAGGGPEAENLHARAKDLRLPAKRLAFIGPQPPRDVANLLASADVFSLPCRKDENGDVDGIPVVLMEAMALGVPCISTALSGIPELIVHGETGLLVAPGDILGLARALRWMAAEPDAARMLARRARRFVWREFSRERNAACLLSLWSEAAGSNRDGAPGTATREPAGHVHIHDRHHIAGPRRSAAAAQNH
jgi:glycosyltransferase involved in cell wall biosynthesis